MMNGLSRQAARGAAWTATAQLGGQLVLLAANVVLARVLMPADFGTASLALVIAVLITAVNQLGLVAAVIQRREITRNHYVTAFTTSIISSAVFGLALFAGAVPVAHLLRNPGLVPVLRLYSLLLPLGAIAAIQSALLARHLMFRPMAKAALAARLSGGITSIVLALAGCGVMSIAWGYIVLNAVNAIVLLPVAARVMRPSLGFSWRAFRELFGYGAGIMGMNLLNQLSVNADVVLVGRILGSVSLGFYSVAVQLASYLPTRLSAMLDTVTFPAFARVQDDAQRLRAAYLRLLGYTALVIAPVMVALAVAAPDVVRVVYGNRWSPAIVLLQVLAAYGLVNGLSWPWQLVYKAQGRSGRLLLMTAGQVVALVLAVGLGSRFGVVGVAAALVGFSLVLQLGYQSLVNRSIGLRASYYVKTLAKPLSCAAIAGAAIVGMRALMAGLSPLPRLLLAMPVGIVVYAAAAVLLDRVTVAELLTLLGVVPLVGRWFAAAARRLDASRSSQTSGPPGPDRICLITSVHPAADVRISHKQAMTLSRAGYDVVLIAPAHLGGLPSALSHTSPASHSSHSSAVRLVQVRLPQNRLGRMVVGSLRVLGAALKARARIYHFHDPELLPVGLLLKILGKTVVYDVHEDYPEQVKSKHYLPVYLRGAVSSLVGLAEKAIAARLDGIVCATDAIAAKFQHGRAITVRNYPLLSHTPHSPSVPRSSFFRLVHLSGTLIPGRGVTSMVRAMELLDDRFELLLAGRFVTPEYEAAVRAMAGFERVRYIESVPHEQVWALYEECDAGLVCLLPLERYKVSLPVKMFEFMAAGLPVIASDFPLFRELVEGNGCGICVDPEAPERIASAARRLAGDAELVRQMGEMGRKAVLEKYNWEAEAQTLLGLYRALSRRPKAEDRGPSPASRLPSLRGVAHV